jgi:hypothetical protein
LIALLAYLRFSFTNLSVPPLGRFFRTLSKGERALLIGLVGVVAALAAVALSSPPNNVDSLLYHLPRVRQWAQRGSLTFFPTTYSHQLFMPPWAEMVLVQLRLLVGSDGTANLLQLASYVSCILGAVSLARSLGSTRVGLWLSAAFVAGIPMGILNRQAPKTISW